MMVTAKIRRTMAMTAMGHLVLRQWLLLCKGLLLHRPPLLRRPRLLKHRWRLLLKAPQQRHAQEQAAGDAWCGILGMRRFSLIGGF